MLSKENLSEKFSFPAYSSESTNNGIIGYTDSPEFICDNEHPVYVTFGDHTRKFNIATESFSVLDNVKVLIPLVYTHPAKEKPVICKQEEKELRKAAIYYRYNSQNSEIDYPELHSIIENEKQKINEQWMKTIRQIGDSGIARTALLDLNSGKMTGTNTSLYVDESLLDEIAFVQEGSFVETGGNPALKVVGQVQTVVGAQRVLIEQERNKAINADEIIKSFITQEQVNNPLEFVKQICYQSTGNMPVYFYLKLADKSNDEGLAFINDVPINSNAKDLLKRRITQQEVKFYRVANTNTTASKQKRQYIDSIINEELIIPSSEQELKYCLSAIRGMERSEIV